MKLNRASVRMLVAAVSGAVAITVPAVGASPGRTPSIPPASLWAINQTAKTYGIRAITLPPTYVFLNWHQRASVIPFHRGRDMVVEFSRDGRLAATWTATRVYPHELARCGNLYGSSRTRFRVRGRAVYAISRQRASIAWMCVTDTPAYPMVYQLWDNHQLARSQLATIVGMSRHRYEYTVSPFIDFWTPSRNIGCLASVPTQGLDPGLFTCYIRSGLRPAPTQRIPDCRAGAGLGFGWGSIVWLVLPSVAGQSGSSEYGCWQYEPVDTSARTLDYGHSIRFAGATCTSMRIGLRCSNEQGHGFFLSRQHSYLF